MLILATAVWKDEQVDTDRAIITRSPEDFEAFINTIVKEVEEGRHEKRAA